MAALLHCPVLPPSPPEQVKATLLNFGIAEKALDEVLKLLPQLGNGERLKLTPVDVPHHDLVAEGFKLGIG